MKTWKILRDCRLKATVFTTPCSASHGCTTSHSPGRRVARTAGAQADVGLVIGTGTNVAIEFADITLVSGSLAGVVTAIRRSWCRLLSVGSASSGAVCQIAGLPPGRAAGAVGQSSSCSAGPRPKVGSSTSAR